MHVAAWPGLSQSHFLLLGQVAAPVLGQEEPHTAEKALGILPGRAELAKEKCKQRLFPHNSEKIKFRPGRKEKEKMVSMHKIEKVQRKFQKVKNKIIHTAIGGKWTYTRTYQQKVQKCGKRNRLT